MADTTCDNVTVTSWEDNYPIDVARDEASHVSIADNWRADIIASARGALFVELTTPGIAADVNNPNTTFPGGVSIEGVNGDIERHQLAKLLVAGCAISGLHEGLEWVRVDGTQIAETHPGDEEAMWDWLRDEMLGVVGRYQQRWPNRVRTETPD